MNQPNASNLHPDLNQFFAAGRSLIMIQTPEEDRVSRILNGFADAYGKEFWVWQVNTGLTGPTDVVSDTQSPEAALQHLVTMDPAPLVWFKDLHHHFSAPVIRALRDLYYAWRDRTGFLIITSPSRVIPNDLEREVAFYALAMPNPGEIQAEAAQRFPDLEATHAITPETVAATLKGLTLSEARHALARLDNQRDFSGSALRLLQEEKRQLIKKTGTLEYIPEVPSLQDLGGLENLKEWLVKRKDLLLSSDEALREIAPKGIMLMGVSGCGKSLCIKAISSAWQIPLYRMEMVRIFSGGYGSPEIAFAEACRIMGEMAPAVLWLDEIEMSLSSEGGGDAALSRIFAFFLTWMQEKPAGLFVAATANRIDLLPAEMIRKGRFDQVFFVDLPTRVEREHIFRIHLQKRGYDPEPFTPEIFADATEGWNGAEIEQFVIAAVTSARMEQRELVLKDLYTARKQIVPISTTMEEQVRHIRNWAYERAVRASAEET